MPVNGLVCVIVIYPSKQEATYYRLILYPKMVKELLLIPFFVFACIYAVHGQFMNGVSSYFKTPNGNDICNGTEVSDCINAPVGELVKWYFYKDRIIGTSDSGYFILNEWNSRDSLYTTYSETEWLAEIKRKDLIPLLWTKWYSIEDGNWGERDPSEFEKHWLFYSFSGISLALGLLIHRSAKPLDNRNFIYGFCLLVTLRVWLFLSTDWVTSF